MRDELLGRLHRDYEAHCSCLWDGNQQVQECPKHADLRAKYQLALDTLARNNTPAPSEVHRTDQKQHALEIAKQIYGMHPDSSAAIIEAALEAATEEAAAAAYEECGNLVNALGKRVTVELHNLRAFRRR